MSSTLYRILIGTAAGLWLLWIIILYLGFHPHQLELYVQHPYAAELAIFVLLLIGTAVYARRQIGRKKSWYIHFRGWQLVLIPLFVGLVFIFRFWNGINLVSEDSGGAFLFYWINSIWYLLVLLLLCLSLTAIGNLLLERWPEGPKSNLVALALGTMGMGFLSTVLGLLGILYGLALAIPLVGALIWKRRSVLAHLKQLIWAKNKWRQRYWWQLPVALLGLFFVGIYWLGGMKAFATGYDGSGLYANLAQLIADGKRLPGAYQAFGWSVVMSWGKLLFGSTATSILLSHFMYVPALALAYTISRRWLKPAFALLAVVLVLSLPMLDFQTMVDEKIDLGLLFISLAIIEMLLHWKMPDKLPGWKELTQGKFWYPAVLLGLMLGFAFSIKYTTVFLVAGVFSAISYRYGKVRLWAAWCLFFLGFIFVSGFHRWGNLPLTDSEALTFGLVGVVGGLVLAVWYFWKHAQQLRPWLFTLLVAGGGFVLVFAPWAMKHLAEHQFELSVNSLLYSKPDRIPVTIEPQYLSYRFNTNPKLLEEEPQWTQLTQNTAQPTPSATPPAPEAKEEDEDKLVGNVQREELQRYLGFEEGIWRYLTIPFDLSFNIHVPGLRHQEIGFIWLLLLPLLLFGVGKRSRLKNILLPILMLVGIAAWFWSLTETPAGPNFVQEATSYQQQIMAGAPAELQSGTFYQLWKSCQQPFIALAAPLAGLFGSIAVLPATIFVPLFLILVLALLFSVRGRLKKMSEGMSLLGALLSIYLLLWLLLGNSISWYAMILWVLLPVYFIYYLQKSKNLWSEKVDRLAKSIIGLAVGLQLLVNLIILLSATQPQQPKAQLFNWPMISFLTSPSLDHMKTLALFDQYSSDIAKIVNRDEEAKIFRVNTYLQFHIQQNNERVLEDNQLDRFARIVNITKQPDDFVSILRDNGFRYILYDLNTYTLDKTPEQSLRQKCVRFMQVLLNSNQLELLVTDNFVENTNIPSPNRLPNGQMANATPGLRGKTVYPGRVALFRIN